MVMLVVDTTRARGVVALNSTRPLIPRMTSTSISISISTSTAMPCNNALYVHCISASSPLPQSEPNDGSGW